MGAVPEWFAPSDRKCKGLFRFPQAGLKRAENGERTNMTRK